MAQLQPAKPLPRWVLELRSDRRASVAIAANVADVVLALGDANLSRSVRRHLIAVIERSEQAGQGIPVSVASRVLDVTEPTARSWIERGVLSVVPGSRPTGVTPRSLGEALAATSTIRQVGQDERLLRRLLDVLDDQRTRVELAGRIDELGDRVPIDPDRISEESSRARRAQQRAVSQHEELPAFLRVEEVARLLRISRSLTYELANAWLATNGEAGLPAVRLGRTLRIPRSAVEQLRNVGIEGEGNR